MLRKENFNSGKLSGSSFTQGNALSFVVFSLDSGTRIRDTHRDGPGKTARNPASEYDETKEIYTLEEVRAPL